MGSCVIRTKGGFAVSCKLGLDFLSIFNDIGKWIGKMGKKLFDATGKAFMEIGATLGDFAGDIYEGAKKAVTALKDKTKKAKENIKKANDKAARQSVKLQMTVKKPLNQLEENLMEL